MLWRDPGTKYTLLFLKQVTQALSLSLKSEKILRNEYMKMLITLCFLLHVVISNPFFSWP